MLWEPGRDIRCHISLSKAGNKNGQRPITSGAQQPQPLVLAPGQSLLDLSAWPPSSILASGQSLLHLSAWPPSPNSLAKGSHQPLVLVLVLDPVLVLVLVPVLALVLVPALVLFLFLILVPIPVPILALVPVLILSLCPSPPQAPQAGQRPKPAPHPKRRTHITNCQSADAHQPPRVTGGMASQCRHQRWEAN